MTIQIDNEYEKTIPIDYEAIIRSVVACALDHENCPYEAEVSVLLTDNAEIALINREQRGIDGSTDVLSFPITQYESPADFSILDSDCPVDSFNPETGELMLGDIVISVDKVFEQAQLYGHSPERELGFLTAHSMLHLMGYDHIDDSERLIMEERQREILDQLGIKR